MITLVRLGDRNIPICGMVNALVAMFDNYVVMAPVVLGVQSLVLRQITHSCTYILSHLRNLGI